MSLRMDELVLLLSKFRNRKDLRSFKAKKVSDPLNFLAQIHTTINTIADELKAIDQSVNLKENTHYET